MSNRAFVVVSPAALEAMRTTDRKPVDVPLELLLEIEKNSNEALREAEEAGKRLSVKAEKIAKDLREAYEGISDESLRRVAKRGY